MVEGMSPETDSFNGDYVMVMRLMIRLSVAKIHFGMVPADDMSLDTESCQSWICQRNNDFWENTK